MAKKYIDPDVLKAEIEKRMGDCDANSKNPNQLLWAELAALLPFLDSLQQEQPDCHTVEDWIQHIKNADTLSKDIFSKGPYDVLYDALNHPYQYCYDAIKEFGELCFQTGVNSVKQEQPCDTCTNDKGCVTCKNGELWEGKEQPSDDLEEAAEKYEYEKGHLYHPSIKEIFIAGAEWQAKKCDEETSKLLYGERQTAYIYGWDDHKEQMLKDAVEGFIFQSADYYPKQLIAGYDGELGMGDKVKIVIVKEDKK